MNSMRLVAVAGAALVLAGGLRLLQKASREETQAALEPLHSEIDVSPELVDLGAQPVGSMHEISFIIENRDTLHLAFGHIESACGTLFARAEPPWIGPGESARVLATQEIQVPGPLETRLLVPLISRSGTRTLELVVRAEGLPRARLLPATLNLGRFEAPQQLVQFVLDPHACLADGAVPDVRVRGDFAGILAQGFRSESGVFEIRGSVNAATGVLGALEGVVSWSTPTCPQGPSARIVGERVPEGAMNSWPNCVVVFRGDLGQAEAELRFPSTHVRAAHSLHRQGASPAPSIHTSSEGLDTVVLLRIRPEELATPESTSGVIQLVSDRGRIQVHWSYVR